MQQLSLTCVGVAVRCSETALRKTLVATRNATFAVTFAAGPEGHLVNSVFYPGLGLGL